MYVHWNPSDSDTVGPIKSELQQTISDTICMQLMLYTLPSVIVTMTMSGVYASITSVSLHSCVNDTTNAAKKVVEN